MLSWARRLLPVGLLVLGACAHSNPPAGPPRAWSTVKTGVDARAIVESVVLCKTTEAELRRALGEPSREGILHRGRVLTWITRSDSPGQYLGVLVNRSGVAVDLYWDIPTEVPWVPTDQCAPAGAPGAGPAAGERP